MKYMEKMIYISCLLAIVGFGCSKSSDIVTEAGATSATVSLSSEFDTENDGIAITATLSETVDSTTTINLTLSGSATLNVAYTIDTTVLVINSGEQTDRALISGISDFDYSADENLAIIADIASIENSLVATDDATVITISLYSSDSGDTGIESLTTTQIAALTTINGQDFYGILDHKRTSEDETSFDCDDNTDVLESSVIRITDTSIASFGYNFLSGDISTINYTLRNGEALEYIVIYYDISDSTCETPLFYSSYDMFDETSSMPTRFSAISTGKFEVYEYVPSVYISDETSYIYMDSSDDIYHYYYPISGSGAGVTINVLEYSYVGYHISDFAKLLELSIETSEETYYARIYESGIINDMADIVTANLYLNYDLSDTDDSMDNPVDYILELDYSANTIRFIEDN